MMINNDGNSRNINSSFLITLVKGTAKYPSSQTKLLIILIIIIGFTFMTLISILPVGDLFLTKDEIESTEYEIYQGIYPQYIKARDSSIENILSFVNSRYNARAKKSDISKTDEGFFIDTWYASIKVSFYPSLSEMNENISSYLNAVNGTINFTGQETLNELKKMKEVHESNTPTFDGKILEKDSSGNLNITSDAKSFYMANSNSLSNTKSSEYIEKIIHESEDFFSFDSNTSRWELINFHQAPKTHYETRVITDFEGNSTVVSVPVTVTAWYGEIEILMFYDLSGYREEELLECYDILESADSEYIDDPGYILSSMLIEYYNDYIGNFKGYENSVGDYVIGTDNRNELFRKLLEDGTLMYVPISGLSELFVSGEAGYSGELGFSSWDKYDTSIACWRHIASLRNSGKVSKRTYMWNCTAFAACWFYENYGVDKLYGNGRDMVRNLLNDSWGKKHFYLASSPAPGGIYSIGSPAGGNHVGCVDAVDYENRLITISDGNTNGKGNSNSTVRIKKTMTFDEFQSYVIGCCYSYGSIEGYWITFANPIEDSF